jgi:hypothetical protein
MLLVAPQKNGAQHLRTLGASQHPEGVLRRQVEAFGGAGKVWVLATRKGLVNYGNYGMFIVDNGIDIMI